MKWQSTLFVLGALASQAFCDTIECNISEDYADGGAIADGIDYVNGLDGYPTAKPGSKPGECSRVSCSYGSGIFVCSDDGKEHPLKSWKTIGDVTQKVVDECTVPQPYGESFVKGTLTAPNGWSVSVHKGDC